MESHNHGSHGNEMSLHTTPGCSMGGVERRQTGSAVGGDCQIGAGGNAGCAVVGGPESYGMAFNGAGGGVSLHFC